MPSYLSSTQTGGLDPPQRLRLVGDGRGQHRGERLEERQSGACQGVVARQHGGLTEVAGEHARPPHVGRVTLEGCGDGRLQVPYTQADAQLATKDGHHVARGQRVAAPQ